MKGKPIRQVSQVTTRQSPTLGLNSYDSVVSMPEGFALILRNGFAQPYGVQVRRGYRRHVAGLLGSVETLASHNKSSGNKLYAFVQEIGQAYMYDVTTPSQTAPPPKVSGLSDARWQCIDFPNSAGVHLICCNGLDPIIWVKPNDTTTFITAGDGALNTISGVDPANLISVYAHQRRLWFVEDGTTFGWYLPPEQLFGVANYFDFGPYWTRGGYLNQIITWTIDDGNGADDHLAAFSSEGEVSIYSGTDVEGADTWSLQGVYFIGAPVGRRAAVRLGGDIMCITEFGVAYLSHYLQSTKINPTEGNDAKYIQQLVSNAITATGDTFGWEPFVYPASNMVMVNVPSTPTSSYQFVMNSITRAWSQFIGYNAKCWELHEQLPFYGGQGAVYRAWEGYTDDSYVDNGVVVQGTDIRAEFQSAFTYFGSMGTQKHYKMVRPTIVSDGLFALSFNVNTDFNFSTTDAPASFQPVVYGVWDESLWNSGLWASGLTTNKTWQAVTGIGTAASIRMLMTTRGETFWAATDWLYEVGGVM